LEVKKQLSFIVKRITILLSYLLYSATIAG
jgi:hypothetical protein